MSLGAAFSGCRSSRKYFFPPSVCLPARRDGKICRPLGVCGCYPARHCSFEEDRYEAVGREGATQTHAPQQMRSRSALCSGRAQATPELHFRIVAGLLAPRSGFRARHCAATPASLSTFPRLTRSALSERHGLRRHRGHRQGKDDGVGSVRKCEGNHRTKGDCVRAPARAKGCGGSVSCCVVPMT
jgi:hypothetical protein